MTLPILKKFSVRFRGLREGYRKMLFEIVKGAPAGTIHDKVNERFVRMDQAINEGDYDSSLALSRKQTLVMVGKAKRGTCLWRGSVLGFPLFIQLPFPHRRLRRPQGHDAGLQGGQLHAAPPLRLPGLRQGLPPFLAPLFWFLFLPVFHQRTLDILSVYPQLR